MSTIQAKIAAKKLGEATGVEDKVAERMFHRGEGGHYCAIVDLAFLERTEGRDEKHVVRLEITQLEVMPEDGGYADHARNLMRAVYTARQPEGLDGTDGETPDDVIQRGRDALLTCQVCIHRLADDTIAHCPDADSPNAFCTWKSDGTEVKAGDDDPAGSQNATDNEGNQGATLVFSGADA